MHHSVKGGGSGGRGGGDGPAPWHADYVDVIVFDEVTPPFLLVSSP